MSSLGIKLNFWAKLIWGLYKASFVRDVTDFINKQIDSVTTEDAKTKIKAKIQSKHKIGGDIRRFLCNQVDNITASSVESLKLKIVTYLNSL